MPKKYFIGLCTLAMVALIIDAPNTVAHAQTFTVLNNFDPTNNGPWLAEYPNIIAQGQDGNLYFTTLDGGDSNFSDGGIFQMTPSGTLTLLASFGGNQFSNRPRNPSGLTLGQDGNFYGTTIEGGSGVQSDYGTVFQVTAAGAIAFLYSFSGGTDGGFPEGPPIQANDGNFYGTTGGNGGPNAGTVYRLTPNGVFTTLYQFDPSGAGGDFPAAPLVQGTDGNLYGTTQRGGTFSGGVVFEITLGGQLTVLHNFDPSHEGWQPYAPLIQGIDGNFYGTTFQGGNPNTGTIYKISPTGTLRVLRTLKAGDGSGLQAGLTLASDGLFYGTAVLGPGMPNNGTIFRIKSSGLGFLKLHDFDNTGGSQPEVMLTQHTSGVFFGDTFAGGNLNIDLCQPVGSGCGVFYSLDEGIRPFAGLLSGFGPVGSTVGILGQGFTGTKKVAFAGGVSPCTVISDTYLTTTVPALAKTGYVTVKRPGGPLKSSRKFVVTK